MPRKSAILSLGTRGDASTWEKGCKALGFSVPTPIKKPSPTMKELKSFFKSQPHWIFFGGHFSGMELYNEKDSVSIAFREKSVKLRVDKTTAILKSRKAGFDLEKKCEVVLWGGCSVCSGEATIRTMRQLFGPHLLLGFAGLTGWKIVNAMLGGGFIKSPDHFFDRVKGHEDDPVAIRDAWMETAKYYYDYTNGKVNRFRAVDPDGQEWKLEKGVIKRGRKIT